MELLVCSLYANNEVVKTDVTYSEWSELKLESSQMLAAFCQYYFLKYYVLKHLVSLVNVLLMKGDVINASY